MNRVLSLLWIFIGFINISYAETGEIIWSEPSYVTNIYPDAQENFDVSMSRDGKKVYASWVDKDSWACRPNYEWASNRIYVFSASIVSNIATWHSKRVYSSGACTYISSGVLPHDLSVSDDGSSATIMWLNNTVSSAFHGDKPEWGIALPLSDKGVVNPLSITFMHGNRIGSIWGGKEDLKSSTASLDGAYQTWDNPMPEMKSDYTDDYKNRGVVLGDFIHREGQSAGKIEFGSLDKRFVMTADGNHALLTSWQNNSQMTLSLANYENNTLKWGSDHGLPAADTISTKPSVDISGDGTTVAAVWTEKTGPHNNRTNYIKLAVGKINGTAIDWWAPVNLTNPGIDSDGCIVKLSHNGSRAIMVWRANESLIKLNKLVKSTSAILENNSITFRDISQLTNNGSSGNTMLAISDDGTKATALWSNGAIFSSSMTIGHKLLVMGDEGGGISIPSENIVCNIECSYAYEIGKIVTLSATPDSNHVFDGWEGACSGKNVCTITMDAPKQVRARFSRIYSLAVQKDGNGSIVSNPTGINCGDKCSAEYISGSTVSLTASPSAGHAFSGWAGECTGQGVCTTTMDSDKSISASFVDISTKKKLTISNYGNGAVSDSGGTISCDAICSIYLDKGVKVTLNAKPADGYKFTGWLGSCSGKKACTVRMNGNKSVKAKFKLIDKK